MKRKRFTEEQIIKALKDVDGGGVAREIIEAWRKDYNEVREHGSLGGLTPAEFRRTVESPETATRFPPFPQYPLQSTTSGPQL